jgi:hypothetical protein
MFYSILKSTYDLEIEDAYEGCKAVIVPVARGHDEIRIVSVVSELAQMIFEGQPCWEFSFSIDVFAMDDSMEPFRTQDRQIAASFLPSDLRPRVMEVVCASFATFANGLNPEVIFWVTKERDPPEKCLKKHHLLRQKAESMGYSPIRVGTDPYSRRFWLMRRNPR